MGRVGKRKSRRCMLKSLFFLVFFFLKLFFLILVKLNTPPPLSPIFYTLTQVSTWDPDTDYTAHRPAHSLVVSTILPVCDVSLALCPPCHFHLAHFYLALPSRHTTPHHTPKFSVKALKGLIVSRVAIVILNQNGCLEN